MFSEDQVVLGILACNAIRKAYEACKKRNVASDSKLQIARNAALVLAKTRKDMFYGYFGVNQVAIDFIYTLYTSMFGSGDGFQLNVVEMAYRNYSGGN